jgi:hypothetical protein
MLAQPHSYQLWLFCLTKTRPKTLNAISPIQPPEAIERTARHLRLCAELADLAMQLARAAAARTLITWAEPEELPAVFFNLCDELGIEVDLAIVPDVFLTSDSETTNPNEPAPPIRVPPPRPEPLRRLSVVGWNALGHSTTARHRMRRQIAACWFGLAAKLVERPRAFHPAALRAALPTT